MQGVATSIAGGLALYFGVLGFVTGYLLTRVFLAVVMNLADRRADAAGEVRLEAGGTALVKSAIQEMRAAVADLQTKFVELLKLGRPKSDAAAMGSFATNGHGWRRRRGPVQKGGDEQRTGLTGSAAGPAGGANVADLPLREHVVVAAPGPDDTVSEGKLRGLLMRSNQNCSGWWVVAAIGVALCQSAAAACPSGYQPYSDRCVTQRMADFISCVEASGANKEEIVKEVSQSGGNKASGGIAASGAGPVRFFIGLVQNNRCAAAEV